jgi:hypothetical protein
MQVLILGAGYAGLNAYYELQNNTRRDKRISVKIISSADKFALNTFMLRHIITSTGRYTFDLPRFVKKAEVRELDMTSRVVVTNEGKEEPDAIIVALGCRREGLQDMVSKSMELSRVKVGVEDPYDEYIALQLAFYLKAAGKDVEYSAGYMRWLGADVERIILSFCEEAGIKIGEQKPARMKGLEEETRGLGDALEGDGGSITIPRAKPPPPLDSFIRVDERLRVRDSVYAAGDVVSLGPKLGELAMRMGVYAAKDLLGRVDSPFRPVFINILENGRGVGAHIRSDLPWGGCRQSVKVSRIRSFMKRFLERYYIYRKGKMGFLVRF